MITSNLLDSLRFDDNSKDCENVISLEDFFNYRLLTENRGTVFFTGAGFSKAWHSSYPLGLGLFSIADFEQARNENNFFKLAHDLSIIEPVNDGDDRLYETDCYNYFTEIKFNLDIFKRYPSLLPSFLDLSLIESFECEMKDFIKDRFEAMVGKDEFNLDAEINNSIKNLFQLIHSKGHPIGFISTNYDFIIEKIFNDIDDLCFNRGVINRNMFSSKKWHKNRIPLYKINGGFELYKDSSGYYLDYTENGFSSHIILPSKDQSYDNQYFKSVFIKSANLLRESQRLVFIGYSLPEEDHTIRFLLRNFVDCQEKDKEIYIISKDKKSALELTKKVGKLFPTLLDSDAIYAVDGSLNDIAALI